MNKEKIMKIMKNKNINVKNSQELILSGIFLELEEIKNLIKKRKQ